MSMMEGKSDIIAENKKRLNIFNKEYNPYTGLGSFEDREEVCFSDLNNSLFLPRAMINESDFIYDVLECGNFETYAKNTNTDILKIISSFDEVRFKYDFEYWAIQTIIIQHKKTLADYNFRLRLAQRFLLRELEKMRLAGVPIRMVLLKARQWGGSTLVQMYMFWIQQIHKVNWHLAVCAQDDGASRNISEMYRRASRMYPKAISEIKYKPYAGSSKNIINAERGGIIGVGSINNPDQFRSFNYPMIHISEPGVWEDTPKRTAGQLVASLRSTVSKEELTMIVLESTAKGVGSFFHNEWLLAESEKSAYKAIFIPWFHIEMYQMPISNYPNFIDSMNDYDRFCWKEGATLEGINWYNVHKEGENYDDWQMYNEFPTTAVEAFVASGQRYFSPKITTEVRKNVIKPKFRGTVHPSDCKNREDIQQSHFVDTPKGPLEIWKKPKPIVTIKGEKFHCINRYCMFGDIGGVSDGADFSSLTVLDRYWMLHGGWPELAADWHGHLDQDLFAWVGAQLGWMYDNALFALETNSLKKVKSSGDHFLTVLDNIKNYYDNLYIRNDFESINKDWIPKYGFHTNAGTKDMILGSFRAGMRDDQYIERQAGACDEFEWFERKKDGGFGAIDGKHDDKVVTRSGAYWLAVKYMAPMKLVPYFSPEQRKVKNANKHRPIIESTI